MRLFNKIFICMWLCSITGNASKEKTNLPFIMETSLCNSQKLLQENHNQLKCRVVESSSNGYIYKTLPQIKLREYCRGGGGKIVRAKESVSFLVNCVS